MTSDRRRFLMQAAAFGGAALSVPARPHAERAEAEQPRAENAFDYKRTWGRWGKDDQRGAVNLITPAKRVAAAALVKSGRSVSLAHTFTPPQHYFRTNQRGTGQSFVDYMGFEYHGVTGIQPRRQVRAARTGATSRSSATA